MSLYRFKSRETADLVMLEPHGRRVLEILGKDPDQPGIIVPDQMPGAIAALRAAVAEEEAHQRQQREEAEARGEATPQFDPVSLRLRTTPFIDMLERCAKARVEVVWGV